MLRAGKQLDLLNTPNGCWVLPCSFQLLPFPTLVLTITALGVDFVLEGERALQSDQTTAVLSWV